MEYQRSIINAPQRDVNESILISVAIGAVIYAALYALGAWIYLNIPASEFHRAAGFWAQWAAYQFGLSPRDGILDAPPLSTWSPQFIEKADTLNGIAFYISAISGLWLGWQASAPAPGEILIRGREITRNPKNIQTELSREGAPDGIHIHPFLKISQNLEKRHLLILGVRFKLMWQVDHAACLQPSAQYASH